MKTRLIRTIIYPSFCIAACLALPAYGNIVQLDESVLPVNPENSASSFTFDDFGAPGAVTITSAGIVLGVVDSNASSPGPPRNRGLTYTKCPSGR